MTRRQTRGDRGGRRAVLGRWIGLAWLVVFAASAAASFAGEPARVVVFAAASMTEAVQALADRFAARSGVTVLPSFAASSALARQIENGAPADVYISADQRWMDRLAGQRLIDADSRCELARNRLVLIAPKDSTLALTIAPGFPLAAALGDARLAIGDPDHVPAGIYGRQALERLGVWRTVENRLVRSVDVRAALALVARGEVPAGVVYATDAAIGGQVRVVDTFPAASHDPIVYPVGRTAATQNPAAGDFLAFITSDEGRAVLAGYGFETDAGVRCSP